MLATIICLSACSDRTALNPKDPITLTLWHNFGGQMQATMDRQVEAFNAGVGREKGIILSVTSVSGSALLQEKLNMIAHNEPGAPLLPDLTTCYPASATILADQGLITPLDQYFSKFELDQYLPAFIEEGRLADGQLYVFPCAKSTEVLFLNRTLFDRFIQSASLPQIELDTFEAIVKTAIHYNNQTTAQTASPCAAGKAFFAADSIFNLFQVGLTQLGVSLFDQTDLSLDTGEFRRIFDLLLEAAVKGGLALYDGYSTDLAKTGDILCSLGSTAGILFYGKEITYADNTKEEVEYEVLPYPVWAGGKKAALQRGGGLVVAKSSPQKQEAAATFLKWFTSPEENMQFVASTGYLPVTKLAFSTHLEEEIARNPNPNVRKLLRTAMTVYSDYEFFTSPAFDSLNKIQHNLEARFLAIAKDRRFRYLENLNTFDPNRAYEKAITGAFEEFKAGLFWEAR